MATPVILIPPVPLMSFELRSKLPPSCGLGSSETDSIAEIPLIATVVIPVILPSAFTVIIGFALELP